MIVCVVVRSSACWETVGRTVMGKSHVIVSTKEPFRACSGDVAVATPLESWSWWAWLLDLWAEFLLEKNVKWTCHFSETEN